MMKIINVNKTAHDIAQHLSAAYPFISTLRALKAISTNLHNTCFFRSLSTFIKNDQYSVFA